MKKDLSNYYLDLSKLDNLKQKESENIHRMYTDMLHYMTDSREMMSMSLFNTLEVGGYLKNRQSEERENKIGELING
jgi:isoleucyl-tRNA synthetase